MTKPRQPVVRVQKPRTAKQVAQAKAYGGAAGTFIVPRDAGLSSESWWVGRKTRAEFSAAARDQRERLKLSRFARVSDPTYSI